MKSTEVALIPYCERISVSVTIISHLHFSSFAPVWDFCSQRAHLGYTCRKAASRPTVTQSWFWRPRKGTISLIISPSGKSLSYNGSAKHLVVTSLYIYLCFLLPSGEKQRITKPKQPITPGLMQEDREFIIPARCSGDRVRDEQIHSQTRQNRKIFLWSWWGLESLKDSSSVRNTAVIWECF